MKIEIEIDDETVLAARLDLQERETKMTLSEWLSDILREPVKCILEDAIADDAGNFIASRAVLHCEAREVEGLGGDFKATYKALVGAAKSYGQSNPK